MSKPLEDFGLARERHFAYEREREVNRQPLSDQEDARNDFLQIMRDLSEIARRANGLLEGKYGEGPMLLAHQALHNHQRNPRALLCQMTGVFTQACPRRMVIQAWGWLSLPDKQALDRVLDDVINYHLERQ